LSNLMLNNYCKRFILRLGIHELILFASSVKGKILETTKYIQWHMHPMNISAEKARCRAINLLGEEFYNNLLKLHEADINAN